MPVVAKSTGVAQTGDFLDLGPLGRLQMDTAKEIDALLPSSLSRAFAGEL